MFSSPKTYSVLTTAGQPIGSLTQDFVDRLVSDVSSFLLGGRGWTVLQINHDERRVFVVSSPIGRQPTWGGFLPQFLGKELCQQILRVLTSNERYAYLDPEAMAVLNAQRVLFEHLDPARGGIEVDPNEIRWWTFAGGRINSTLRYALSILEPEWTVIPDNFAVKIRGSNLTSAWINTAIARLREEQFWNDETIWANVRAALPNYRLSKFQPLMPDWVERETLSRHLLDADGTRAFLSNNM